MPNGLGKAVLSLDVPQPIGKAAHFRPLSDRPVQVEQ